jgi:hypothetical protein
MIVSDAPPTAMRLSWLCNPGHLFPRATTDEVAQTSSRLVAGSSSFGCGARPSTWNTGRPGARPFRRIRLMRSSQSTPSRLASPLLGVAIAVSSSLPGPYAAAQTSRNNAERQIQAAQADHTAAQFDISRDFLVEFADNLKTFADFGKLLYDFRDLKLPPDASAATRAFFDRIRPIQDGLARGGREVPDQHELLQKVYDVVKSLREDLARPHTDPLMATLSSQTLQTLRGMAFDWVTSSDTLQKWATAGKISQPFARYTGFLSFGADDLAQGMVGWAEHGTWRNPETAAHGTVAPIRCEL